MSGNTRDLERNCDFCGKTYLTRSVDVKNGKGLHCSISCGAKTSNGRRPKSISKKKLAYRARKIYIERHGNPVCRVCGKTPADVHHKDGNPINNDDFNHDPLCRSLHIALENRLFPKRRKTSSLNVEVTVADPASMPAPPQAQLNTVDLVGAKGFDVTARDTGDER